MSSKNMCQNSQKTKVTFILGSMGGGGAERAVVEIITHMDRSKFNCQLCLYNLSGPYLSLLPSDTHIINLGNKKKYFSILFRLLKTIKLLKDQSSVFISSLPGPNITLLRSNLFYFKKRKCVITEQNNLSVTLATIKKGLGIKYYLKKIEIKLLYPRASKIIAVSDGIKQDLIDNFNIDGDKIEVIYNPVNTGTVLKLSKIKPPLPWPENQIKFLVVAAGRLVAQKGYRDLINVFSIVQKRHNCKLVILGQGPEREKIIDHIQGLGLADDIYLAGFVNNPWSFFGAAKLFLSASYWEGFNLTLAEAMAAGTAVISTNCDYGPREIITDGVDGMLIPVGDINAMASAVINLIENDRLRLELAKAGKQRSEFFNSSFIANKYENMLVLI